MRAAARAMVILAPFAVASAAPAQAPPEGTDIVGIYSNDFDGPTYDRACTMASGTMTVHLVFTGLSEAGIAGWGLQVDQDGTGVQLLSATLRGEGAINACTLPAFRVELPVPLTEPGAQGSWPVASLTYFVLSTDPTVLYVHPAACDEVGIPYYLAPKEPGQPVPALTVHEGGIVFGFNGWDCGIGPGTTESSWGTVKALFR